MDANKHFYDGFRAELEKDAGIGTSFAIGLGAAGLGAGGYAIHQNIQQQKELRKGLMRDTLLANVAQANMIRDHNMGIALKRNYIIDKAQHRGIQRNAIKNVLQDRAMMRQGDQE